MQKFSKNFRLKIFQKNSYVTYIKRGKITEKNIQKINFG